MKIYLLEYGEEPSDPQASVIIAENEDEAEKVALKEITERGLKRVKENPKELEYDDGYVEYTIKEIPLKKGMIYTGHYCC